MLLAIKAIVPYVLAFGLLGIGGFMMRHTSRYSRTGGEEFERRMKRRVIGIVLVIAGIMFLCLAVLNQFELPLTVDQSSTPATPAR
jgi:O-antigen/teichoic acid export membrane protein